jgi:hypothetical protein
LFSGALSTVARKIAAVLGEDRKRAFGIGRIDHAAEADAMLKTSNSSLSSSRRVALEESVCGLIRWSML